MINYSSNPVAPTETMRVRFDLRPCDLTAESASVYQLLDAARDCFKLHGVGQGDSTTILKVRFVLPKTRFKSRCPPWDNWPSSPLPTAGNHRVDAGPIGLDLYY